jgi:acetyltransferase-like isoleucine patch superfamily enzyme
MLKSLLAWAAHRHGRFTGLYRRFCRPDGYDWARWLARHGGLHAMGRDCFIVPNVTITDPAYLRLGDNVRLTGCTLFGHDGSVNMINRAYGLRLDRVGKIDIGSDVFIGHGAIVLPGVTIGSRVLIGAGAVVARDVPSNSVLVGSPARRICSLDELAARFSDEMRDLPWADAIANRVGSFDPILEPALRAQRAAHFFGTPT